MTIEIFLWSALGLVIALNLITSIPVAANSPEYSGKQRIYKILFVWLIPIIGACFILGFRRADRAETLSIEEAKKAKDWAAANDSWGHG